MIILVLATCLALIIAGIVKNNKVLCITGVAIVTIFCLLLTSFIALDRYESQSGMNYSDEDLDDLIGTVESQNKYFGHYILQRDLNASTNDAEQYLDIKFIDPQTFEITGFAWWAGDLKNNPGAIHFGDIKGELRLIENQADYADDDGCKIHFVFENNTIHATESEDSICGGVNVNFNGTYFRTIKKRDFGSNTLLTEKEAEDLLINKIETDRLYKKFTTLECLAFYTDTSTVEYFEFTIREIHGNGCAGDPHTHPRVDSFRIMRATNDIFYYDVVNDWFLPYKRSELER